MNQTPLERLESSAISHPVNTRTFMLALALGLFLFNAATYSAQPDAEHDMVYLFTSFEEPADAGLKFLWSEDGLCWERVPGEFLRPQVGKGRLMRDPSLLQGPDGVYQLVWTTGWRGDLGFGHAHSRDLVHWSPQQFVPVMEHEPEAVNVWAPELFYNEAEEEFIVAWATTITDRFPRGQERADNNHRMYFTRTKDFVDFSPAKLFCDPGFSVIDSIIVPWGKKGESAYKLVLKDNTRPVLALRVAEGDTPIGPWRNVSNPITGFKTEGPSVAKVGDEWFVYFDRYGDHEYGALATSDFCTFRDLKDQVRFPMGHKHGTVIKVTRKELDYLLNAGREQTTSLRLPFKSPLGKKEVNRCPLTTDPPLATPTDCTNAFEIERLCRLAF